MLALIAAVAAWSYFRPNLALRVATGAVAHDLCSETFVSGHDPAQVWRESLAPRPGLSLVAWGIGYTVDRGRHAVTARFLGGLAAHARHRPGVGCVLEHDRRAVDVALSGAGPSPPESAPVTGPPALASAVASAFAEPTRTPHRWTKAVVVMRDGEVLAERYAPGETLATPLLGFSMSKSVTNALLGILVREGRLRVAAPAPIVAWQRPGDPRAAITIEQLMRMDSGLDLDETGSGFDPSNRMFYVADDMAGYAMRAPLRAPPGTRWAYSSASTQLLARIVRDRVGGTGEAVQRFARDALFAPLDMRHVTMEMDATGTPVGAHYILASARDWARFGQLFLDDGVVRGRRLLPAGWVAFSARQTPGTDYAYGAGWWTNRGGDPTRLGYVPGAPADAFFAFGNLGQRLAVIPSRRLVIVRMARSHLPPGEDNADFGRLVAAVIAAAGDPRAIRSGTPPAASAR